MEKTQKTKKPLILAAVAFVVLVAAGLVIWKFTAPQGTAGAKASPLSLNGHYEHTGRKERLL